MKDQAQIVIIGGGIYGVKIAYHLSKMGRKDMVLLEKGEIASGESSHAAGVVTQFATSKTLLKFRKYSIELYSELGLFDHVGSLRVASSKEQLKELERSVSRAKAIGMDVEIISPSEAFEEHAADHQKGSIRRDLPAARWTTRPVQHHHLDGAVYPRDGRGNLHHTRA